MLYDNHTIQLLREEEMITPVRLEDPFPLYPRKWIELGPFVLETGMMPETEYLYHRSCVLDQDFLASSGGEASCFPYPGMTVRNDSFGERELHWKKKSFNRHDTSSLTFDSDSDALYRTVQRSCCAYAAAYLECETELPVILRLRHTGILLFHNGKAVFREEEGYNRVDAAPECFIPLILTPGINCILIKVRTGSIADGVDFSIRDLRIEPVRLMSGSAGMIRPARLENHLAREATDPVPVQVAIAAYQDIQSLTFTISDGQTEDSISHKGLNQGNVLLAWVGLNPGAESAFCTLTADGVTRTAVFPLPSAEQKLFSGCQYVKTGFHFDTTYHEEQRVYALGAFGITRHYMDLLRKNRGFKAIVSAVDYLHPYYSTHPEDRELLRESFREGRLEPDDFYNQPNEITSSSEGLVRNAAFGQLYHREVLGRPCMVYSPEDVFGHPNQLSQICRKAGCVSVSWGKNIIGFYGPFLHMSPDGSTLIHRPKFTPQDAEKLECGLFGGNVLIDEGKKQLIVSRTAKASCADERCGVPSDVLLPASRGLEHFRSTKGYHPLPLTSRDMSLYHIGSALSRTDLKQANRLAENLLTTGEKLSVMAALSGGEYPEYVLDKAWRQILCGQHHDSITGTHNEISLLDLLIQYREAVELAQKVVDQAMEFFAANTSHTQEGEAFLIFNPHTWERREPVTLPSPLSDQKEGCYIDPHGNPLPMQITQDGNAHVMVCVPPMGYTSVYRSTSVCPGNALEKEDAGCIIENDFFVLEVDPERGGTISRLFDKKARKEVLKENASIPGNCLCILCEDERRNEALHEFYTTGERLFSSIYAAEVRRIAGPVRQQLFIRCQIGEICCLCQTITLTQGSRRIDFRTEILDYQKTNHLFSVAFPTAILGAKPVFDDRYSVAVRSESRGQLDFRTQHSFQFSHCQVYCANQWMEYGQTVPLTIDDGAGDRIRVNIGMTSIIRSWQDAPELERLSDRLLTALTRKCIPVTVYSDQEETGTRLSYQQDLFNTDTRFVLDLDGTKNGCTERLKQQIPCDLLPRLEERKQRDGFVFVFLTDHDNRWKKPIDTILLCARDPKGMESAVGQIESQLENGSTIFLEGCTATAERRSAEPYGVALLNLGNPACSVEKGGLLNLMLFHTGLFYGNIHQITDKGYIPEQKSHVFQYALYPHEGDFREARTAQHAMEFQDPLLSIAANQKADCAFLPDHAWYLESDPGVLITACKAAGFPVASMKKQQGSLAERDVTVRFYEPNGRSGQRAQLRLGFPAVRVRNANLLEDPGEELEFRDGTITYQTIPYSIETLRISLPPFLNHATEEKQLPPELFSPIYIRSWDLDQGAAPMGFLGTAAFLDRNIRWLDKQTLEIPIVIVNNWKDSTSDGQVQLVLPEGFSTDQSEFSYHLRPQESCVFHPILRLEHACLRGAIRLRYMVSGLEFFDVCAIRLSPPEMQLSYNSGSLVVKIRNVTGSHALGLVSLASPIETWGNRRGNPFCFGEISPWNFKVDLDPGETGVYSAALSELDKPSSAWWAAAKLMLNGQLYFSYLKHEGGLTQRWNARRAQEAVEREGSYNAYLDI